jgi:hypothetical protein
VKSVASLQRPVRVGLSGRRRCVAEAVWPAVPRPVWAAAARVLAQVWALAPAFPLLAVASGGQAVPAGRPCLESMARANAAVAAASQPAALFEAAVLPWVWLVAAVAATVVRRRLFQQVARVVRAQEQQESAQEQSAVALLSLLEARSARRWPWPLMSDSCSPVESRHSGPGRSCPTRS